MLEQPELLILDEPTNHLDIDTKNIVEDVFEAYDGPIIFISHDRYFINKVATKIISISDSVSIFDGNYSQYIEEVKRFSEIKKLASPKLKKKKAVEDVSKKIRKLEKKIDILDIQLGILKQELFLEEVYMHKEKFKIKSEKIKSIENQIEEHYLEIENISD
jgi:ATP-binding cassette subfamily F protein 3